MEPLVESLLVALERDGVKALEYPDDYVIRISFKANSTQQ